MSSTMEKLGSFSARELGLTTLYIDLNSCFASVEQQARPRLREKPVAITNRLVKHSTIIAASVEAKALGIKVGMRLEEAKIICPKIIEVESEPEKYIYVHKKLKNIMYDFSPRVIMKSIDEGLIDLREASKEIQSMPISNLASNIKFRIKDEIGCSIRSNVGFGQNRFFAKLASELHKPDGADVIIPSGEHENIREVFEELELRDLPGINKQYEKRLKTFNINTPLDMLEAKKTALEKQVFKSIEGAKWYDRLRGVEVDERSDDTKTIGRQFVLPPNTSEKMVKVYLAHLCEDVGARLRSQGLFAHGLKVWRAENKISNLYKTTFCSDEEIMKLCLEQYSKMPKSGRIIGVTLYKLQENPDSQTSFFQNKIDHQQKIAELTDSINSRFGNRKIHSAYTLGSDDAKCKIPFGSTKYFQ